MTEIKEKDTVILLHYDMFTERKIGRYKSISLAGHYVVIRDLGSYLIIMNKSIYGHHRRGWIDKIFRTDAKHDVAIALRSFVVLKTSVILCEKVCKECHNRFICITHGVKIDE